MGNDDRKIDVHVEAVDVDGLKVYDSPTQTSRLLSNREAGHSEGRALKWPFSLHSLHGVENGGSVSVGPGLGPWGRVSPRNLAVIWNFVFLPFRSTVFPFPRSKKEPIHMCPRNN